jgi:hypothetical protein
MEQQEKELCDTLRQCRDGRVCIFGNHLLARVGAATHHPLKELIGSESFVVASLIPPALAASAIGRVAAAAGLPPPASPKDAAASYRAVVEALATAAAFEPSLERADEVTGVVRGGVPPELSPLMPLSFDRALLTSALTPLPSVHAARALLGLYARGVGHAAELFAATHVALTDAEAVPPLIVLHEPPPGAPQTSACFIGQVSRK